MSALNTVLTVLGSLAAGVGTVFAALYVRARNRRDDLKNEITAAHEVRTAAEAAGQLAQQARDAVVALRVDIAQLRADLTAVSTRASVLESKMDVFWKNVAFDVSKILHSPHAGWGDLDTLLEKFRAGSITGGEMADLIWQLHAMVEGKWESAQVTRADQVAASLLLRAIEQTRV